VGEEASLAGHGQEAGGRAGGKSRYVQRERGIPLCRNTHLVPFRMHAGELGLEFGT
jgi:hypothetical protein